MDAILQIDDRMPTDGCETREMKKNFLATTLIYTQIFAI